MVEYRLLLVILCIILLVAVIATGATVVWRNRRRHLEKVRGRLRRK